MKNVLTQTMRFNMFSSGEMYTNVGLNKMFSENLVGDSAPFFNVT